MRTVKIMLMMLCLVATIALAQSPKSDVLYEVNITVVDSNGEPLPGATIKSSDKKVGTATDINGKVSLWVAKGSTLTISYIGMQPKVIKMTKALKGEVTLDDDAKTLDQVVVTGYTQTDVRKSTGSVSIISGKELNDAPLKNVDMLLQGKLAGVSVQAVSGRPGEAAKVRVRGISSITGSSEPLWVVDGVPIQKNVPSMGSRYISSGDFSTLYANGVAGISPQNIESINVLKDASAAAIYGSQAQAGVIVITTKKGEQGRTRVSYSGSVSVQTSPVRDDNLMNSQEKLAYEQGIWDEFAARGYANGTYYPIIGLVGQIRSGYGKYAGWSKEKQDSYIAEMSQQSTDWFDQLFQNTVSTSHSVSVSGGTDKQTFYISGGMSTNNGIVRRTNADSYNFSAKINGTPLKNLSYSASIDFSYLTSMSPSQSFDIFRYAYFANPYERLYNDDGSYRADETYFSMLNANGDNMGSLPSNGINVMREINETTTKSTSNSTVLRADLTWHPLKDFRVYGLASATFANDDSDNEIGKNTYAAWQDRPFEGTQYATSRRIYGSKTNTSTKNVSWLARLQANYSHTFADIHRVSAVGGTEVRYNKATSIASKMYGYDPLTGNHTTPLYLSQSSDGTLSQTDQQTYRDILNMLNTYSMIESAFASFYGAVDYVYNNKYVWNATIRSDGSNNFGSKEQFNLTWSTGLAWNIDEEPFFNSLRPLFTRATVRVSTGLTGGVNKGVYPQVIMNYQNYYRSSATDSYRVGVINSAPNPNLRWEHTRDYNASLDFGMLKDRLNVYFSAYRRRGYDLVTSVRVVNTTGYSTQKYNTTEQINQGFELSVNGTVFKTKDFSWSLAGNVSYNQNFISKYEADNGSDFKDVTLNYPQGAIFSGKSIGINEMTGIYNYALRPEVDITEAEQLRDYKNYVYYLGTANAPWTGGISTNVSYKNFTLSMSGSFSLGNLISNHISAPQTSSSFSTKSLINKIGLDIYDVWTAQFNKNRDAANRWTEANPVTNAYPRLVDPFGEDIYLDVDQPSLSNILNAVYYESGSYFKIGSLSLMYNMPSKIVQNMGLSSMGFSFTASNLLMISGYSGLNPETPGAVYPISRSFSFGINVGL